MYANEWNEWSHLTHWESPETTYPSTLSVFLSLGLDHLKTSGGKLKQLSVYLKVWLVDDARKFRIFIENKHCKWRLAGVMIHIIA